MAARPTWQGHLKLSLVTCPVALYKATEAAKRGVSFNYINPQTNDRVRMKPADATTGQEVERSELVKCYQVDKGLYVDKRHRETRALHRVAVDGEIAQRVLLDMIANADTPDRERSRSEHPEQAGPERREVLREQAPPAHDHGIGKPGGRDRADGRLPEWLVTKVLDHPHGGDQLLDAHGRQPIPYVRPIGVDVMDHDPSRRRLAKSSTVVL